MRLDHIAYRVKDRTKTADFFIQAFNYKIQIEFDIQFDDGTTARCLALEPSEKIITDCPWAVKEVCYITTAGQPIKEKLVEYHMAPEIFVSDGEPDSIVGQWVARRDGIGGIHHLAYQVASVQEQMDLWKSQGFAEFTSEQPLTCPGLTQVFTKPSALTGVIYEFITREQYGFCRENVKQLMISTKNLEADFQTAQIIGKQDPQG